MTLTTPATSGGPTGKCDVCVVGAGPAGLMLAVVLARFGVNVELLDERPDQTSVGRADGIQPKTIETLQMLGLGDELLREGVRVYDICMWRSSKGGDQSLKRMGREVHYPASVVDVLHPFILLCHQGMVEGLLVDDLRKSGGVEVKRSHEFESLAGVDDVASPLQVKCKDNATPILADYVVGCDGARSKVRSQIPDTYAQGTPHNSVWGVLDGELDTNFPDIWSKTVVYSEEHDASVLIIPRERNMTRFYIELPGGSSKDLGQEFVMDQARKVMAPYRLEWTYVEWFGNYAVAQRVTARFMDPARRVFIAGDASHTHSPKAAQGLNTSVHDSWNLGWKLNLAIRGLAKESLLLESYETERKKIAHDLINFDYEHANQIAGGDAKALAENFRTNIRFISGVGVEYGDNLLNQGHSTASSGAVRPGCILPPAKVTRYIDANPVDIQLDIPVLGQFRIFVLVRNIAGSAVSHFLSNLSQALASESSLMSRISKAAAKSYSEKPRPKRRGDAFVRPERYTPVSQLFTFALVAATEKSEFELDSLPPLFSESRWTVYTDDVPHLDSQGASCVEKWLGNLAADEVAIVNVRPDGYVGSIKRWDAAAQNNGGEDTARWLDEYYGGFLEVPAIH